MSTPECDEFGRALVLNVRDQAIRECDMLLRANSRGPTSRRWKKLFDESVETALHATIPDIVDCAISTILRAIDQEILRLKYVSERGRDIDLIGVGQGELSGEYMGGWRAMYSAQRFVDSFGEPPESA